MKKKKFAIILIILLLSMTACSGTTKQPAESNNIHIKRPDTEVLEDTNTNQEPEKQQETENIPEERHALIPVQTEINPEYETVPETMTPEWLIGHNYQNEQSLDADINMLLDAEMTIESEPAPLKLNMTGSIQTENNLSHIQADMDLTIITENVKQHIDQWATNLQSWAWDGEKWLYSEGSIYTLASIAKLPVNAFRDLEIKHDSGMYMVTGELDPNTVGNLSDLTVALVGFNISGQTTSMPVTIYFNDETYQLKALHIDIVNNDLPSITYKNFNLDIIMKNTGEISLRLPEELVA